MTAPASRTGKLLLGAGLVLTLHVIGVSAYHTLYRDRIFPGVRLDGAPVGGLTKAEFLAQTETGRLALLQRLRPLTLERAGTPDRLRFEIPSLLVNGEYLWDQAFQNGRDPKAASFYAPISLRWQQPSLQLTDAIMADPEALRSDLASTLARAGWTQRAQPAEFRFESDASSPEATRVRIEPAKDERELDLTAAADRIMQAIRNGDDAPVPLPFTSQPAPFPSTEALSVLLPQAQRWASAPVTLKSGGTDTILNTATLAAWTEVVRTASGTASTVTLGLNRERVEAALNALPSTRLQEPLNGSLTVNEQHTVTSLTLPTRGQKLNLDATLASIVRALDAAEPAARVATTTIDTVYATFEGPDAERLGIRELLGQGVSNFAGSPSNRRKNIALGASKINQTLVAPGAEFSTLTTLGKIDGENGWLPELVIKGNKTIPEYGGGLCQVSTTVFRSALNVGLPITERRNHSYRVRYYEPMGTDASIYEPDLDFKFRNDTPNWLLITQERDGDTLRFLMWGTKDGRVASTTDPVVTRVTPAPPKKLIETTEIPVGTTKCTESEHAGATARFDYAVQYANGPMATTTFTSVYRPWQAVCLVGVAPGSAPTTPAQGVDASGQNSAG